MLGTRGSASVQLAKEPGDIIVDGIVASGDDIDRLKRAIAAFLKEADIHIAVQIDRKLNNFATPQ